MSVQSAFSNQLRLLHSIDKSEINHSKIDEWWPSFNDNPPGFFLRCDDSRQSAIWDAMLRRGA